jgi:sigma-E factor negative regulatory protein RseC
MEEQGVVKSIEGVYATVLVARKSACDQCKAGTCHVSGEGAEIEALNKAQAQVGQTVRVVMQPYTYLKGSLMVYGMPALGLILGAVLGKEYLSPYFPGRDPDGVSAVAAFAAFALCLLLVKIWSARAEKKVELKPVIEEVVRE